jgi:hypothetical protein
MLLVRMHLSLLISMVALWVATMSYLRAARVERDHRHLRRRFREFRSQIGAQTRAEGQRQEAEERIASAEASPRNGDRTEQQQRRLR